ncbi:hypothetical protein [Paraburkholderia sp. SIMBA_030]|uniref:hypothetical protein n=1 Tax=Paraburkholderia sp. SIMBA_030 TaxID=3085773 RepID=UPI0039783F68
MRKFRGLYISIAAWAFVLNTFLMRPAALGQEYVWVAMVLSPLILGGYLLSRMRSVRSINSSDRRDILFIISALILYWLYEAPIGIIGDSDQILLAKELLSSIIVVICYGVFLIEREANIRFFRAFSTILALLGLSAAVTFALALFVGTDALYLFPITVKGYGATDPAAGEAVTGAVYFPMSMLYGIYSTGDVDLNRYSNFFREAGIYQAVSIFFLAYERLTRRSRWRTAGLIAGSILSYSTIGLLLLPLTGGLVYMTRRRVGIKTFIVVSIAGIAAVLSLIFTPGVGLTDKSDSHSTSVSDRSDAIWHGIAAITTDPVGAGVYNLHSMQNSGICLLAAIASIGIIGFAIQCVILSGIRPGGKLINPKVIVCFPIFITALLSQPIAGAGMSYILSMVAVPAVAMATRRRSAPTSASIGLVQPNS